jgi:hypothetical protein
MKRPALALAVGLSFVACGRVASGPGEEPPDAAPPEPPADVGADDCLAGEAGILRESRYYVTQADIEELRGIRSVSLPTPL